MPDKSAMGFLQGLASWSHWWRLVTLVAIVFLFATVVVLLVLPGFHQNDVRISFRDGSTVFETGHKDTKAIVLVPAGQLWLNTGLKVGPDHEIEITASGLVNLAVHRLVEAAADKHVPRHLWIGPDGSDQRESSAIESERHEQLIDPTSGYGKLLGCFVEVGTTLGKNNWRPRDIQAIGKNGRIKNRTGRDAILWLVVNDTALNDNIKRSRAAFVPSIQAIRSTYFSKPGIRFVTPPGGEPIPASDADGPQKYRHALEERWEEVRQLRYWDVWFDDNIGEFLAQVDLNPDSTGERGGSGYDLASSSFGSLPRWFFWVLAAILAIALAGLIAEFATIRAASPHFALPPHTPPNSDDVNEVLPPESFGRAGRR